MNRLAHGASLVIAVSVASLVPASAQQSAPTGAPHSPPFTTKLSNNTSLVSGMGTEDASRALRAPFSHISGRPGDEIYLAIRNIGGSGLIHHNDRLYLQFRNGRLAGWKGDWGHNWMWQ
jgi:hypothetical protein